jgi:hypothetical protein
MSRKSSAASAFIGRLRQTDKIGPSPPPLAGEG